MLSTLMIFIDAAVSPPNEIAVGGILYLDSKTILEFADLPLESIANVLADKIQYFEYKSNKSTWTEIKTLIHALTYKNDLAIYKTVEVYTDCQSLCDLLGKRKDKLINSKFLNRSGKELTHANVYRELFALSEKINIKCFKIKGHQPKINHKTLPDQIFSIVDKCTRKHLRKVMKTSN